MTRDIYEGVDSEGTGGDGVRDTTGGARRDIWSVSGPRPLLHDIGIGAACLLLIALTGCHPKPQGPDAPPDPIATTIGGLVNALCPDTPIATVILTCRTYTGAKLLDCVDAVCSGQTFGTPEPRPSATAESTPRATPSTGTPSSTTAPTATTPAVATAISEQPVPIGGDCVEGGAPSFVPQVRAAQAIVEQQHRDWFQPDRRKLIHQPRLDYDFAIVRALRDQGLDAAVDACLCDEIAVANKGDATFNEQYAVLVSSGDVRDPIIGGGYRSRCTPRGWTPGASVPTAPPAPVATNSVHAPASVPAVSSCPCLNHINVGPLGQWPPPFRPHTVVDDKGVSWSCYTIDTTPRFNPNGDGMPDNDEHPNYGGYCEYPGAPTWTLTGVRADAPSAISGCEPSTKPGARGPRCGYQYAVCGKPGEKFTITAWPPLPLTDLYGNPNNPCAGGDGHGTFVGEF